MFATVGTDRINLEAVTYVEMDAKQGSTADGWRHGVRVHFVGGGVKFIDGDKADAVRKLFVDA